MGALQGQSGIENRRTINTSPSYTCTSWKYITWTFPVREKGFKSQYFFLFFSLTFNFFLLGILQMFVRLAKISTPLQYPNHSTQTATAVKFSPDGTHIAIAQHTSILLFDFSKLKAGLVTNPTVLRTSHVAPISDICWSPDSQCIATASDDYTVEITHVTLYGTLHRLVSHTAPVISLCYNHKGNLLFTSSMDESVKIWDTLNGSLMKTISAHSDAVVSVDVPADDTSILGSGSYDGLVRIFDAWSGHCLKTLTYDKDWKSETGVVPVTQIKFSLNGKFLLVKTLDGVVKLWDCIRGNVARTFRRPDDTDGGNGDDNDNCENGQEGEKSKRKGAMVHSCGMDLMYTAKTPILISGYEDGEIYCWEVGTKKLVQVLHQEDEIDDKRRTASPIISIDCFGNYMCSLALDSSCYLWQLQ